VRFSGLVAKIVVVASLAGAGCTPAVHAASAEIPKTATPAVADASLKVLEDPQTRDRIAAVLGTPEVQKALAEISEGLSIGVLDGLSREQLAQRLKDLDPVVRRLAGAIGDAIVRSAADEVRRSLGPAIREALDEDMAPAFAAMLRTPELRDALGEATREVAKQAVYGSNDALASLAEQRKLTRNGPIGAIGAFFDGRTWLLVLLAVAAAFAIPLAWLVKERAAAKRYHLEAERRTAETASLLRALDEMGDAPISRDLLSLLRRQYEHEPRAGGPDRHHA